jgi:hypothetical protein
MGNVTDWSIGNWSMAADTSDRDMSTSNNK